MSNDDIEYKSVTLKFEPDDYSACYNDIDDSKSNVNIKEENSVIDVVIIKQEVDIDVTAKVSSPLQQQFNLNLQEGDNIKPNIFTNRNQRIKNKKRFPCDICDKSFINERLLIVHKRVHTGEKPYLCDICKKSFSQSGTLVVHMRTHTGEKPYSCSICKKSFTHKSTLLDHKRTHFAREQYICKLCNKSFTQPDEILSHAQTHSGNISSSLAIK